MSFPTVKEINNRTEFRGTAISLFAGCGGSSLGYRAAGFRIAFASEFVPAARDVYRLNARADTIIDDRDIRKVDGKEILSRINLDIGELDLLDGSPPCASFSTAGKRERGWGEVKAYSDTAQRTDDLFNEYIRLVQQLRPKTFIAENVSGLVKGKAFGVFRQVVKQLRDLGYRTDARIVQAEWLGVPQTRHRLFIMGIRSDLQKDPLFPTPLKKTISISDACPWITNSTREDRRVDLLDHDLDEVDCAKYAIAKKWQRLQIGEADFSTIRVDANKPCNTLTTLVCEPSAYSVMHPSICRKFTPAEARRLSGFPDDFQLLGDTKRKGERMGRAVAPPVSRALGECVLRQLGR